MLFSAIDIAGKGGDEIEVELDTEERLRLHAEKCYELCTRWFGTPRDSGIPWRLFPADRGMLTRLPLCREYLIWYPLKDSFMAVCVCIGHEMYHRVTANVSGLREQLWVEEMMACMTSYRVMQESGWRDYEFNVRGAHGR